MAYNYKLVADFIDPSADLTAQLADLVELVRTAFPSAEFYSTASNRVHVFYRGDAFAMGELQLVWDHKLRDYNYVVRSPHIKKERGDQYAMQTSKIKVAAKTASKFFRRQSNTEAMSVQAEDAASAVFRAKKHDERLMNDLARGLLGGSVNPNGYIMQEFRYLLTAGHRFHNPEVHEKIEKLVAAADAVVAQPKQYPGIAVWMHEVEGETVFDVAHIPRFDTVYQCKVDPNYTRYRHDTLPEAVAGKLSLLSMVDPNHAVVGVGVRAKGNMFYLEA
jgi:hypothetical protein